MRKVLMIGGENLSPFQRTLEEDGYEVVLRAPGETAENDNYSPDVILLDLAAGAEDTEVKRILKEAQTGIGAAVIAVVDPQRPSGFDPALGLDDFLATTASPGELTLRLRQALWRRTGVDARNVLRCGDLEMDLANYTVHIAGQPVDLTYKEYELLRFLATNPDRVLNRETLLNRVWGYDFYGGSRTVDVHIRRLRSKIEDRHHTFIETVRNVGYRFHA
ncbi:MAG: response regulator transcription factor [Chloroflexi bacterium]|nr:response regulator transcription factor [Chloroflexota bacterium]